MYVSSFLVSVNYLKKLWIIKNVWQLDIYIVLNKLYVDSFIFNNWCIENQSKRMDM